MPSTPEHALKKRDPKTNNNKKQTILDYNPELMGRMFIINAPFFFAVIWRVIKGREKERERERKREKGREK